MQNFVGFDANAMIYNRQYVITAEAPRLEVAHGAFVRGLRPSTGGNLLEDLIGGAFSADGSFLAGSAQPRSDGRNAILLNQGKAQPSPQQKLVKAVFGGIVFDHFGHFLLESTSRLWCLPEYANLPWIFLTVGRSTLPAYQLGFLEVLGLAREQIVAVEDWQAIDELIIPEPAFIYHHKVNFAYREIFRRTKLQDRQTKSRRIYLSRSNMTIALTVGERELEVMLARDGWEIVYPETLSPQEQALLFRENNVILGLQGSAMHLGLFAPDGRRVFHLCRGQGYRGYYILDELVGAEATYFQAMLEPELRSRPITGPFLLDLDATLAFLRQHELLGAPAVAAGREFVANASNRLAEDYEAWWFYTESQIRFHRHIDDRGADVPSHAALEPALKAAALRPRNTEIVAHSVALTLKFEGANAAHLALLRFRPDLSNTIDPTDGALLHLLSIIKDSLGDYPAALEAIECAIGLNSEHPIYANQRATVLFRLGRNDEAEAGLLRLVSCNTANAATYCLLSMLRDCADDLESAVSLARTGACMDRQNEGLCRHLVNLLRRQGAQEEARVALAWFLEGSVGSPSTFLEMADIEEALGRTAASADHLTRAFALAPDDLIVRDRYVKSLVKQGLFPSLSQFGVPHSAAVRQESVMIYKHSLALSEGGRLADALLVAVVAAELCPENIVILNNLLGLMLKNNRAADGRLLAKMMMERGSLAGESYYVLSLIEGNLGNFVGAREAARQAALTSPTNDVITEHFRRLSAAQL